MMLTQTTSAAIFENVTWRTKNTKFTF